MAELSRFFNSVEGDERTYQANDFAQFFSNFLGNGFFEGLEVSAENTTNTIVAPGSAFIEGHEYTNTTSLTLTHDPADSSNDRIDRIVLRLNRDVDVRNIRAFIKKGTEGSNPEPPELTRNDYVWEISLAQVRIEAGKSFIEGSQITDERGIVELCGRVSFSNALTDQISTVDIKRPTDRASEYIRGHSVFYVHGDYADILQEWLDSVGFNPASVGRSLSSIRVYVETNAQRTDTGVQTITIFDWAQGWDYKIYGKFSRASNSAFTAGTDWGSWHEEILVQEEGITSNGRYVRYTNGWQECTHRVELTYSANARMGGYWTFPESFVEEPNVQFSIDHRESDMTPSAYNIGMQYVRNLSNSEVEVSMVRVSGEDNFEPGDINHAFVKAEGRWR
jgi:phenolic acid decarboxylase